MRFPDDDVDDFYPEELDQPASKPAKPKEMTARRRLIPQAPHLRNQRLFYIYMAAAMGLCGVLTIWVFVNRAERDRLNSSAAVLEDQFRQLEAQIATSSATGTLDKALLENREALMQRQHNLIARLSQRARVPYLIYIPVTLVLAWLLYQGLRMVGQIGSTTMDFLKGGVCLIAVIATALTFNVAFVIYFLRLQMWLFSIAFGLMVISIVLIISPNLFIIFMGGRFRRNAAKVETLEELQERLPFDD